MRIYAGRKVKKREERGRMLFERMCKHECPLGECLRRFLLLAQRLIEMKFQLKHCFRNG